MRVIFPDSGGLREYNACHDEQSGRFAQKGRGRCLGDAARLSARRKWEAEQGGPVPRAWLIDPRVAAKKVIGIRKDVRSLIRKNPAPAYMQQDIQRALRTDAVLTSVSPPTEHTQTPGKLYGPQRVVMMDPRIGDSRAYLLSALRHEHGHADRTPLGAGHGRIGNVLLDKKQQEEVRAWKNAIRNSGGKVSYKAIARTLATYFIGHSEVVRQSNKVVNRIFRSMARDELGRPRGTTSLTDFNDKVAKIDRLVARRFVRREIIPILRRYGQRVKRAAKTLKAA